MVSYDTTQIALFVSVVLTVAAVGIALVLGVVANALIRYRRTLPTRPEARRSHHGRLAFHH